MEDDLKKLSRMTAPRASDEARARALAAAMTAFEAAEKDAAVPQGTEDGRRQSSIATKFWSLFMSRKLMLASSALATLLIVPAAGYVTLNLVRDGTVTLTDGPIVDAKKTEDARLRQEKAAGGQEVANPDLKNKSEPVDTAVEKTDMSSDGQQVVAEPDDTDAAPVTDEMAETEVSPGILSAAKPMTVQPSGRLTRRKLAIGRLNEGEVVSQPQVQLPEETGDRFTSKDTNPVKSVLSEPVSTFSIDVDTASYAYARQAIMNGRLPTPDSVRVEEMINYFPYDWKGPDTAKEAFKANVTVMPTPWNQNTKLMHVAIKGYDVQLAQQPPANLVFLIDVSGSMDEPGKLPLLKSAFRLLVNKLKPTDTVSIVVYAGNSGVVLEPTKVAEKQKILDAIDNLRPGGATAGADGIEAAYKLAEKAFQKNGVNRVMLATDGDFNVGPSSDEDLKRLIEEKRKSGIFLSVLGFGTGNYNDGLMQVLAQNGNGIAAYIDSLSEAQKTLVQEATSSLFPIAKDVKIQVEFNPAQIAEYRLIGYETRALKREDFNNDKIDAGEIGSG
ncbi:MAG: von Willebrand factor type A domain-containing protein, partial [Rhizobiaceae bacterium]|nr:von Willebrand factor type A domain-containing protein [Rhizobiaceae bacterium]